MRDEELQDHPEGGRFKEVYRSGMKVAEGRRRRDALTHIYFSLDKGEVSRFHKVQSDEVWNLYEGSGLSLFLWDEAGEQMQMQRVELSVEKRDYCFVVRAGLWQAAASIEEKVLVGCTVAPGFEFQDFELIDPDGKTGITLVAKFPELKHLVHPRAPLG